MTAMDTLTLRVTPELKARIDELAKKKLWSINKWCVHALEQAIRPR